MSIVSNTHTHTHPRLKSHTKCSKLNKTFVYPQPISKFFAGATFTWFKEPKFKWSEVTKAVSGCNYHVKVTFAMNYWWVLPLVHLMTRKGLETNFFPTKLLWPGSILPFIHRFLPLTTSQVAVEVKRHKKIRCELIWLLNGTINFAQLKYHRTGSNSYDQNNSATSDVI